MVLLEYVEDGHGRNIGKLERRKRMVILIIKIIGMAFLIVWIGILGLFLWGILTISDYDKHLLMLEKEED